MKKISCVLFDLGGVLINWENSWLIDEISEKFQLSRNQVEREFEKNLDEYSSGKISEMEFWHKIGEKIGSSELKRIEKSLYGEFCREKMSVNEAVYALSKRLKEKAINIGIVSNTEQSIFSIVEEIMPMEYFDYKFLSYKIGLTKPNEEIFEHIIEKISFNKEEVLFIDDDVENIKSAKLFGIDSIRFISNENLFEQLQNRGIL